MYPDLGPSLQVLTDALGEPHVQASLKALPMFPDC